MSTKLVPKLKDTASSIRSSSHYNGSNRITFSWMNELFHFELVTKHAKFLIAVLEGKVGRLSEDLQSGTLNMFIIKLNSIAIHRWLAEWVNSCVENSITSWLHGDSHHTWARNNDPALPAIFLILSYGHRFVIWCCAATLEGSQGTSDDAFWNNSKRSCVSFVLTFVSRILNASTDCNISSAFLAPK